MDSIVFRPIQAKLRVDTDLVKKMDPYCKFTLGGHSGNSYVADGAGRYPYWNDMITLERKGDEHSAKVVVKDKDFLYDDTVGEAVIDLDPVLEKGKVSQWYTLESKGKVTGEVLLMVEHVSK